MPTQAQVTFRLDSTQARPTVFFNRFRIEKREKHTLLSFAYVSESSPAPAVRTFAISGSELSNNDALVTGYLAQLQDIPEAKGPQNVSLGHGSTVEVASFLQVARVGETGDISIYVHDLHGLADRLKEAKAGSKAKASDALPSFFVVTLRSDLDVQLAFLRALFLGE